MVQPIDLYIDPNDTLNTPVYLDLDTTPTGTGILDFLRKLEGGFCLVDYSGLPCYSIPHPIEYTGRQNITGEAGFRHPKGYNNSTYILEGMTDGNPGFAASLDGIHKSVSQFVKDTHYYVLLFNIVRAIQYYGADEDLDLEDIQFFQRLHELFIMFNQSRNYKVLVTDEESNFYFDIVKSRIEELSTDPVRYFVVNKADNYCNYAFFTHHADLLQIYLEDEGDITVSVVHFEKDNKGNKVCNTRSVLLQVDAHGNLITSSVL